MAIPVGAHGTTTYRPRAPRRTTSRTSSNRYGAQGYNYSYGTRSPARVETHTRGPYYEALRAAAGGGGGGGGFSRGGGGGRSGGGGGYGRGGGGGGGPSAYEKFLIDEEKRKQRELAERKAALTKQLQGARGQAIPLLNRYFSQYGKDIGKVYGQNRALNAGYGKQLGLIAQQLQQSMSGQQASLQRDLQGQGAGSPDIQALLAAAQQANAGTNFLNQTGQQYNTRLAQAMAMAQADAGAMGAGIRASSLGNLENSYANLLGQIGLIGLGT